MHTRVKLPFVPNTEDTRFRTGFGDAAAAASTAALLFLCNMRLIEQCCVDVLFCLYLLEELLRLELGKYCDLKREIEFVTD